MARALPTTGVQSPGDTQKLSISLCFISTTSTEEQSYHSRALAIGLLRQVDYFLEKIRVPADYEDMIDNRDKHIQNHQEDFTETRTLLLRVITLLTGTKDTELHYLLAQAHFILGDMRLFFALDEAYIPHFQQAAQLAPTNPIYVLRASEHLADGKKLYQAEGIFLIRQSGYSPYDFYEWDKEQWQKERSPYLRIPADIHALGRPDVTTVTPSLWNMRLPSWK
ncbi:MAG: tetratricopeptide repeat protein [Legionellaceae bacterium]|nr:tetratricopeptide repeat protein [Legionellaceae bacterium]